MKIIKSILKWALILLVINYTALPLIFLTMAFPGVAFALMGLALFVITFRDLLPQETKMKERLKDEANKKGGIFAWWANH